MKIIDGLKLMGKPAEIPDCSRDELPEFFKEMGFKVGAEIGVAKGEYTEKLCQAGLKIYAVDPWLAYGGYENSPVHQQALNSHFEITKNRLKDFSTCTIVKKSSMEAAKDFEEESLDFVYIDADHEFRGIADDISEWTKKVKKGGVVAGHDYAYFKTQNLLGICHVIPVVNAYTQAYKIDSWYVLGRKNGLPTEKRDKWRSWMFVKK